MTDEELRKLFENSEASTRRQLEELRKEIRDEMSAQGEMLRSELRGEMSAQGDTLRAEMQSRTDELKHYFDLTKEAMRDDIKWLAESIGFVNEKFEREFVAVRAEMAQGFKETQNLVQYLYNDLDRRIPR